MEYVLFHTKLYCVAISLVEIIYFPLTKHINSTDPNTLGKISVTYYFLVLTSGAGETLNAGRCSTPSAFRSYTTYKTVVKIHEIISSWIKFLDPNLLHHPKPFRCCVYVLQRFLFLELSTHTNEVKPTLFHLHYQMC